MPLLNWSAGRIGPLLQFGFELFGGFLVFPLLVEFLSAGRARRFDVRGTAYRGEQMKRPRRLAHAGGSSDQRRSLATERGPRRSLIKTDAINSARPAPSGH